MLFNQRDPFGSKMKAAIDFTFIYDLVKDMYSEVDAKVFL